MLVATAHPAKFAETVEPLVGESVPLPESLARLLELSSHAVSIPATLQALPAALTGPFLLGGGLQVGLTVLAAGAIAALFGIALRNAIFLGFLAALSSTAIVLKAYADRRELQSAQGSLVTGILLFQDFCLAPMIVLTPVLAGSAAASLGGVLGRVGLGVLLVAVAFVLARRVMPWLLHWIVRTRVRVVFLLGSLGVCLGMGMLTGRLGFSMALGAFLAGLVVS